MFERGRSVMPGSAKGAYFFPPFPLSMQRGEGCHLWDVDGHQYLDCANHHTAQILGHNHPKVIEVVQRQIQRGVALGAPVGVETELAELLCQRVASLDKVRFCNSGTEATLHAIRLARGFTGRPKIAKFEGGYHGSHDVVEVSVAPPIDEAGPEDAPHSIATTGGLSVNAPGEVVVLPYDNEQAVERLIEQHRAELACVILDPKAGIVSIRPQFVQAVRAITKKHDVPMILDEIVGFRVGSGGLQEHYGIQPDLTTFGKIVGGGFPAGAFGGRADMMNLFDNSGPPTGMSQSGTFSAHAVAMAAGLATLEQMTPQAYAHLNGLGKQLRDGLTELFAKEGVAAQVVMLGSVFSIYFSDMPVTNYRALAQVKGDPDNRVFFALLARGYYLAHGLGMNALSLPMQPDDIDGLVEAVGQSL